jgi:Polyketide cyclase / dehydrase and lipid transport
VATIDHSLTIQARPGVVFDYLTDPEKATVWQSSLLDARLEPDEPMRQGTRIIEVRKLLGRKLESVVEVTELEPERLFAGRLSSGPVPFEFRYTLEKADDATRLDFHMEGEPGGFFRLAEPLVVRRIKQQQESDFATLKELAETA